MERAKYIRKPPLTWVIFSRTSYVQFLVQMRREQRLPRETLMHGGKMLGEFIRVSRDVHRVKAYSERQARLVASNGGTVESFRRAMECGMTDAKYLKDIRYIAAESAVVQEWFLEFDPSLDPKATRMSIWIRDGLGRPSDVACRVRESLSSDFTPLEIPVQNSLPFKPDAGSVFGKRKGAVPTAFNPKSSKRVYRIVDLHEYERLLAEEQSKPRDREVVLTSGMMFRSATCLGTFTASSPLNAVDLFRLRVAGGMMSSLEHGRFTPVPTQLWEKAVQQTLLPNSPSAKALRRFFSEQRQAEITFAKKERAERSALCASDPWNLIDAPKKRIAKHRIKRTIREPGLDFEIGEQLLLQIFPRSQLMEFPPRERLHQPMKPAIELTAKQRSWVPLPHQVYGFGPQLELDFRVFRLILPVVPPSRTRHRPVQKVKKRSHRTTKPGQGRLF